MITDSVKEKIGMDWEILGHFYIDREVVPDLDSFRHTVPSGHIAKISNDVTSGPAQVCIIGLPRLFTPNDADFIQILATLAFLVFEFEMKYDRTSVSFVSIGTMDEYADGVLHCQWASDGGPFGGPWGCADLLLKQKDLPKFKNKETKQ